MSRLRIAAWTETSSAEVGSSQTTIRGLPANARAIATRCLSPPESWAGRSDRWRSARRTSAINASSRCGRRGAPVAAELRQRPGDQPRPCDAGSAPSRGSGRRSGAPSAARACACARSGQRRAVERDLDPGRARSRPSSTRASVVLPLPDSPTSPSVSPAPELEIDVDQAVDRLAGERNVLRDVADADQRPIRAGRSAGRRRARPGSRAGSVCARSWKWQREPAPGRRPRTAAALRSGSGPARARSGRRRRSPAGPGPASRQEARDRVEAAVFLACPRRGNAAQQADRVGVAGIVEDRLGRPLLDQLAGIQDADALAHLRDHARGCG